MQHSIESRTVSHEFALHILEVAVAEGRKAGVDVAVTVADPALAVIAYLRADGTTPHSAETSRRKAQTAASTRRATGWMEGELSTALPLGTGGMLTNVRGGVPIRFDGVHLGGLGIAGGPPDTDARIAAAVLTAIGADVV